jgi:hypothetical protein
VNKALLPASKTLYQLVKQQLAEANLQVMKAVLVLTRVLFMRRCFGCHVHAQRSDIELVSTKLDCHNICFSSVSEHNRHGNNRQVVALCACIAAHYAHVLLTLFSHAFVKTGCGISSSTRP